MQVLLRKIASFSLISVVISTILLTITASASEEEEPSPADVIVQAQQRLEHCLIFTPKKDNKGVVGPDDGFMYTIVEEPLSLKPKITKDANGNVIFEERICFRNTISYIDATKKAIQRLGPGLVIIA